MTPHGKFLLNYTLGSVLGLAGFVAGAVACAPESDNQPSIEAEAPTPGTEIETNSGNDTNPPPADIDPGWTCEVDEIGWSVARGTLTNHSSGTSSYGIEITFNDPAGVQYATGLAFVGPVQAGQTAEWDANSLTDARDGTTCEIVSVDRWAA